MGIRQTLNDFKPSTRVVLILSFVVGLLLLTGFTLTDVGVNLTLWGWDPKPDWLKQYNAGWFHSHAYVPNIFAALTGFLIGAPVALIVLAAFTVQREEQAALGRVNRLSQVAWYNFLDAVIAFVPQDRRDAVQNAAPAVEQLHDWAFEVMADYINYIRSPQSDTAALPEKLDAIRNVASQFDTASQGLMLRVKDSRTIEVEWSKIVGAWNMLDQYVRLQRLEQNPEWFDPRTDAQLRMWMSRPKNPLQEFTDIHGFAAESRYRPVTMQDAAAAMRTYAACTPTELLALLHASSSRFGYSNVGGYNQAHRAATYFLISLLGAVAQVEGANWPGSASKPVVPDASTFTKTGVRWLGSLRTPEGLAQAVEDLKKYQAANPQPPAESEQIA
jgi:hypothetical protein